MKDNYRQMRTKQLSRSLASFSQAKAVTRPSRGWLRAIREALGIPLEQIGRPLRMTKQAIKSFEIGEANDRITLRNLRRVADAMDCELVYAIVPKEGSFGELAERRARSEATKRVRSVHRSMALEDQASSDENDLIDQETKRITKQP
jgi:predicted DNA-binding mobile mystery protein A